jgi:hypothetical protein
MKKSELWEGVMELRFEKINDQYCKDRLTTSEASELLGISVRTFLRKRGRPQEEDFDGRFDRRLKTPSWRRACDQEIKSVTQLYATRYRGFNVKHFHEFARREHGLKYGYTWTKRQLEKAGLVIKSKRGGDHRLRRERRPMEGMMVHQDASTHNWIEGLGHNSSFRGIRETIEKKGLFSTFYTDRGSHYWHTPEAGGRVSKRDLTEVGLALKHLGIQHIAAYSPQARGRSERMFGTLQGRLPQEISLMGITTMAAANMYLNDIFLPRHNKQFCHPAADPESVYIPWIGVDLREVFCLSEERAVGCDNTVSYQKMKLSLCGHKNSGPAIRR